MLPEAPLKQCTDMEHVETSPLKKRSCVYFFFLTFGADFERGADVTEKVAVAALLVRAAAGRSVFVLIVAGELINRFLLCFWRSLV